MTEISTNNIFFLSSLDSEKFKLVRKCRFIKIMKFNTGKQCALAEISPVVAIENCWHVKDISQVILTNRHKGSKIFPLHEFPLFVFICAPLFDNLQNKPFISRDDLEIIGWGDLYKTWRDAEDKNFN